MIFWCGNLPFTSFFSHIFVDYRYLPAFIAIFWRPWLIFPNNLISKCFLYFIFDSIKDNNNNDNNNDNTNDNDTDKNSNNNDNNNNNNIDDNNDNEYNDDNYSNRIQHVYSVNLVKSVIKTISPNVTLKIFRIHLRNQF